MSRIIKNLSPEQLQKLRKELETYTIEQLEEMILNRMILNRWNISKTMDDELDVYLETRQRKINKTFEWTPENMEKLLQLNQKLINCFEKLKKEAKPVVEALQKRVDEKDDFLHDFEIEARVRVFILVPDEDGELDEPENGIERVLHDSMPEFVLSVGVNSIELLNDIIYLEKDVNWNIFAPFKEKFSEHFISYAIHDLYDHTYLSLPDILRINQLWTELEITLQNFEDIN
jgi:hypothetical protein